MMRILSFDCYVPGWCSFRIPHSINAHLTYPAPPPATVYGLIANALGLWQDDYSLLPQIKTEIRILKPGSMTETFTQWMKWNPPKNSMTMTVVKQKLIQPAFRIYVQAKEPLLERIHQALREPARILYLGESDDMVELTGIRMQEAIRTESKQIDSSIPYEYASENPLLNHATVVRWPVAFEENKRNYSVRYELAYVGERLEFSKPVSCWRLSHTDDYVCFGGDMDHADG